MMPTVKRFPTIASVAAAGLAIAGCSEGTSAVQRPDGYTVTSDSGPWWIVLILFAAVMGVALLIALRQVRRVRPDRVPWWIPLAGAALVVAPLVGVLMYPTRTIVTVDATSATVAVEKDFILRPSQVVVHLFDDVTRVRYHYTAARGEDRARGTVLLDLTNGETVEVFRAGPSAASRLATAISQFAQVPFIGA